MEWNISSEKNSKENSEEYFSEDFQVTDY